MYGLACMLGVGMDSNIEAAQYWLKRSADLKDQPGSLYARSLLFEINQFTQKFPQTQEDKDKILDDLRKAADEGDVYANHLLVWEAKEESERSARLDQSANWLFPDALMQRSYEKCLRGEDPQPLKESLDKGHMFAAFLLGLVFLYQKENPQAIRYFKQAADEGIAQSYAYLADLCLQIGKKDKAITYLKIGTRRGMQNAMYGLGLVFLKGYMQDKNYGYELLREAASRGSDEAKLELANRYQEGVECVPDEAQAARYRKLIQNKPTPFPSPQLFQSLVYRPEEKREVASSSSSSSTPGYTAGVFLHHEAIGPTGGIGSSYESHRNTVLPASHQETIGPTGGIGQNLPFSALSPFPETRGLTAGIDPSIDSIEKEKPLHPKKKSHLDDVTYTKHSKKKGKGLEKKYRTINQPTGL